MCFGISKKEKEYRHLPREQQVCEFGIQMPQHFMVLTFPIGKRYMLVLSS